MASRNDKFSGVILPSSTKCDIREHYEVCGTLPLCHFDAELSGARNPKPCSIKSTTLVKPFIPIWFHEMSRQRFWPLRSTARHDNLMSHSVRGGRMTWSCLAPPRAPGFGACVAPVILRQTNLTGNLRIPFFFDSKKERHKNIFGTLCCTCFCVVLK